MYDKDSDSLGAFCKANVGWTKKLAEAAMAAKVKRFVFISSLYVNGFVSSDHVFSEEDKPNPPSPYAISR